MKKFNNLWLIIPAAVIVVVVVIVQFASKEDPTPEPGAVAQAPQLTIKRKLNRVSPDFVRLLMAEADFGTVDSLRRRQQANSPAATGPDPFNKLTAAQDQLAAGNKAQGVALLKEALNDTTQTPRLRLLNWRMLRQNGVAPAQAQLLGLVFEVPVEGKLEYLAVYPDFNARYINNEGRLFAYNQGQSEVVNKLIVELFAQASTLATNTKAPTYTDFDASSEIRISYCTTAGIKQQAKPFAQVTEDSPQGKLFIKATVLLQTLTQVLAEKGE